MFTVVRYVIKGLIKGVLNLLSLLCEFLVKKTSEQVDRSTREPFGDAKARAGLVQTLTREWPETSSGQATLASKNLYGVP